MDTLRKDLRMSAPTSSLEIVPAIDPVLEQVMTKVKMSVQKVITSFEHKGPKVDARSYSVVLHM